MSRLRILANLQRRSATGLVVCNAGLPALPAIKALLHGQDIVAWSTPR